MNYLVMQLERGESGAIHLQGAIATKTPIRLAAMKKILMKFPTIHLEQAQNWEKTKEYVTKTETRVSGPWTKGEDKVQGQRSDLACLAQQVADGESMRQIAVGNPKGYVQYHKGLSALQTILHPPTGKERRVMLAWGPTGTGKTRMVFDQWPEEDVYIVADTVKGWFDGYLGEKIVLFDECGAGMLPIDLFKRLTDRYKMQVQVKGGFTRWDAETIILTSNSPIEEWWPMAKKCDLDAVRRRVQCFEFPKEEWLAKAWCRGGAVKRSREVITVEEDDKPIVIMDLEPEATWID